MQTDLDKGLKIAILDIESTDLTANDGYMLCACVKTVNKGSLNGAVQTVQITPEESFRSDDRRILKELVKIMDEQDVLVGWYSSKFDHPFINTRCLKHGIKPPRREFRRDLCMVARGIGKLKNNRLASWGKFFFGESGKSFLPWATWINAIRGKKKDLDLIVHHCKLDVIETEKMYKKFMPLLGKLRRG